MSKPRAIAVWDPLVRIFHWSVVTLFLLNYWWLEPGETPHEWAGYAILALLALRVIWGFIGSHNARFRTFWPTPARLREHWQALRGRRLDPREGHNPVGALMVFLLMTLLLVTAISGWMQGLDRFWGEDWVEELHEIAANILWGAVIIHVSAVLLMGRLTGIALIRPMLTGRRTLSEK